MFARTSRLLLRPGFPEDLDALRRLLADEQVMRDASAASPPHAPPAAEEVLQASQRNLLPVFLITRRTSGAPELVGVCGLNARPSGAIELGCWVARGYRGQGIASEACAAVIEIAATLELDTLQASQLIDHAASSRLLQKLGFKPIGITAAKASCVDGSDSQVSIMRLPLADGDGARASLAA